MFTVVLFKVAKKWKPPDVHRLVDKQNVVKAHNGVLNGDKKEHSADTCCKLQEPGKHYAK